MFCSMFCNDFIVSNRNANLYREDLIMGEYARLNKMLREEEEKYRILEAKPNKTDWEVEMMIDIQQGIGEIKGTLIEMADVDGLDDPYEAFDY